MLLRSASTTDEAFSTITDSNASRSTSEPRALERSSSAYKARAVRSTGMLAAGSVMIDVCRQYSEGSVEIVAVDAVDSVERPEALRFDRALAIRVLKDALHDQTGVAEDRRTVLAEQGWADDGLRHPRLILEREENEPLRGSGARPDDYRARGRDAAHRGNAFQSCRGDDVVAFECSAIVLQKVNAGGQLHGVVVGGRFLEGGHLGQGRVRCHPERSEGPGCDGGARLLLRHAHTPRSLALARDDNLSPLEQLSRRPGRLRRLPERRSPCDAQRPERACIRELRHLVITQTAAMREIIHGGERLLRFDLAGGRFAQSFDEAQTHPHAPFFPPA